MLRLSRGQRRVLIDRVPELANFGVGSVFFGQLLSERTFSLLLAVGSVALWFVFIGITFWLIGGEDE